jgi:hypothetical protein
MKKVILYLVDLHPHLLVIELVLLKLGEVFFDVLLLFGNSTLVALAVFF